MNNLKRNRKRIYLCEKYEDGMITKYKAPEPMRENYNPTNSEGDLIAIGLDYPMYLRIKTSAKKKDKFHPKDRCYVYVKPPTTHDVLCSTADYEVCREPLIYLNEMEVMLKRLSDDNDN